MSELDDELEDLEPSSAIATEDGFDEPKQTTAALTMEINKLRQKNEVLRQFNVRQKDKYKHEVRSFLTPVIEKYRDVNGENEFLRTQIKELSQKISSSPLLIQQEDLPAGQEQNPVDILQKAYNEKEKEVAVLNKMVKNMEEEVHNAKKNEAEIPALRELLKQNYVLKEMSDSNRCCGFGGVIMQIEKYEFLKVAGAPKAAMIRDSKA